MHYIVIRHGMTRGNEEHRFMGRTDISLSEKGIRELEQLKEQGTYRKAEKALEEGALLFLSPMTRCRQSAEILFPGRKGIIIPELIEVDFGIFEGKSAEELSGTVEFQAWIDSGKTLSFPGGEDFDTQIERITKAMNMIDELSEKAGQDTAVIVAHGGTVMSVNHILKGGEFLKWRIQNGEMVTMERNNHLEEGGKTATEETAVTAEIAETAVTADRKENTGHVRRAEEKDIPRLLELLVQVDMVHHNGRPDIFKGPTTKYNAEELKEILQEESTPVFVYVDENDRALGHAFCMHQQVLGSHVMTDVKTLYIDDICVDEAARGQHVGSRLYEHVIEYAKQYGCYNVTLNVWSCNPVAQAFYEKMGMSPQKIGMETIL